MIFDLLSLGPAFLQFTAPKRVYNQAKTRPQLCLCVHEILRTSPSLTGSKPSQLRRSLPSIQASMLLQPTRSFDKSTQEQREEFYMRLRPKKYPQLLRPLVRRVLQVRPSLISEYSSGHPLRCHQVEESGIDSSEILNFLELRPLPMQLSSIA